MENLITEADFLQQVADLAHIHHWLVSHFRSVRVERKDGSVFYQTPIQLDAKGFPDLVLTRGPDIYFVEVKSEQGKLSTAQEIWLDALGKNPTVRVFVWKPSDWELICSTLQ